MSEYIKVIKAGPSVTVLWKGGPGSGNFGHEGRPGKVGGSGPGGGGQVLGVINEEGGVDSTMAGKEDTHDTVSLPHSFMEKRWRYDPQENGVFSWSNLSRIEEANLRDHIKDRYGKEPAWIRTPNNPGAGRKFFELQAIIKSLKSRSPTSAVPSSSSPKGINNVVHFLTE